MKPVKHPPAPHRALPGPRAASPKTSSTASADASAPHPTLTKRARRAQPKSLLPGVSRTAPTQLGKLLTAARALLAHTPLDASLSQTALKILLPTPKPRRDRYSSTLDLSRFEAGPTAPSEWLGVLAVTADERELGTALARLARVEQEIPLARRKYAIEILSAVDIASRFRRPEVAQALMRFEELAFRDAEPVRGMSDVLNEAWVRASGRALLYLATSPPNDSGEGGEAFVCRTALNAALPCLPRMQAIQALRTELPASRATLFSLLGERKLQEALVGDYGDEVACLGVAVQRIATDPKLSVALAGRLGHVAELGSKGAKLSADLVGGLWNELDTCNEMLWAIVREPRIPDVARAGSLEMLYLRLSETARALRKASPNATGRR